MEMPPSKYEREIRFIDAEVARLNRSLQALAQSMPASPLEAAEKADQVLGLQDKISALNARRKEIEQTFLRAGMDIPDISRSMNATVHNAGAFEVMGEDEAERLAGIGEQKPAATVRSQTIDDVTEEIRSVSDELAGVETRMVAAEIDGDDEDLDKLRMMASSLRDRRDALVRTAKQMRAERPSAPAAPASDESARGIEALEADNRALRSQIADVRSDLQDMKEQLRQVLSALGVGNEEERERRGPRAPRTAPAAPTGALRSFRTRSPCRIRSPACAWPGTPPC